MNQFRGFALACALFLLLPAAAVVHAQGVAVGPDGKPLPPQTLSLPYGFYNEKFGAAAAYVYGKVGYPQPQAMMLTTAMVGSNGSAMAFLIAQNIQVPFIPRLFLDPIASVGYFRDNESFISGNEDFPEERAGSNDSRKKNFVTGDGWDNYARVKFKYLLPIGYGRDHVIGTYTFEEGLLKSGAQGGDSWNPLRSGKTYFEVRPFYRSQEVDGDDGDFESKTNGVDVGLYWDNRDLPSNPSYGNSVRFRFSRDPGAFDSTDSWTSYEGEIDQYFSLGSSDTFKRRVLAFDVWGSYSPTWHVEDDDRVTHRPPAYTGATLGGLWRMRGYPSQRFNDRAAIYYAAEYRMTPRWNPFVNWNWIQKYLGVQWIQVAPFAEVGRVSPEWKLKTLHQEMKWDVGLGLRLLAKGIVIRLEPAYSEEGLSVQMIIAQPFQF